MKILAFETSCDETAAAIVEDGRKILGSALYSQIDIHREYGGVVPEIASRNHLLKLPYILDAVYSSANLTSADIDAVAVTNGPGLVGALLTGVTFAKSYAYSIGKPLIAVNHIAGHVCANYLTHSELTPPFLCLIVSGGHTELVQVLDYNEYGVLGKTRDDAAGEALDKVARLLGLPYPGGPNLETLALTGEYNAFAFTRSFKGEDTLDFSFSGMKTAAVNLLHKAAQSGNIIKDADLAASFLTAVVYNLLDNAFSAIGKFGGDKLVIAGGVGANFQLRREAKKRADESGVQLFLPDVSLCTDNAAMIGSAAYFCGQPAELALNAEPNLALF